MEVKRKKKDEKSKERKMLCRGRATSPPPLDLTTTASPMHAHCSPLGKL